MPALKPLPSLARVEANRANAQQSTGPKTEAGKAQSRRNAAKHGLTGEGIALPTEDEALVRERFAALNAELAPSTVLGAYFVGRIALMTVRTQRAARQEAAALTHRIEHAPEAFDQARRDQAQAIMDSLDENPEATHRVLLRSPEGIDLLTETFLDLRAALNRPNPLWSTEHEAHYEACHGRRTGDRVATRGLTLSMALRSGQLTYLAPSDQAVARSVPDPKVWVARTLMGEIDTEIARLAAHRATLDHEGIALDRAGAADRALFDPSPDANRARRYEAAATRELYRALAEFRAAEANPPAAPLPPPIPHTEPIAPPEEPIDEPATIAVKALPNHELPSPLASFGSEPIGSNLAPMGAHRAITAAGPGGASELQNTSRSGFGSR